MFHVKHEQINKSIYVLINLYINKLISFNTDCYKQIRYNILKRIDKAIRIDINNLVELCIN